MINIFSRNNKSLIDAATLQQILDDVLSPRLERLGLKKATNYLWHEPAVKEIRQGFSYSLLKGAQGTFTWGLNLDFLPMISSGKVVYHKSAKKYVHHLFEWTDEYAGSFTGGKLAGGVTTHFGLQEAKKSIEALFQRYELKIANWFDTTATVENLIDIAERQVSIGEHFNIHHPRPKYVLTFLYAKANQHDKATKMFDTLCNHEFNNNEEVKEKLKTKLLKLTTEKNGT
jgi:hypothetical protein